MFTKSQIADASFDVRRRAKLCRTHEEGNRVWVETPEFDKDNRVVEFYPFGIMCVSTDTGEQCKANEVGKHCCRHVFAANRRKEINAKRRRTLAMKKQESRAA